MFQIHLFFLLYQWRRVGSCPASDDNAFRSFSSLSLSFQQFLQIILWISKRLLLQIWDVWRKFYLILIFIICKHIIVGVWVKLYSKKKNVCVLYFLFITFFCIKYMVKKGKKIKGFNKPNVLISYDQILKGFSCISTKKTKS